MRISAKRKSAKYRSTKRKSAKHASKWKSPVRRLPKLPEREKFLIKQFDYKVHESKAKRHSALDKAVAKYGVNHIIWHLSWLRNITAISENKQIFATDTAYVQSLRNKAKPT